MVLFYLRLIYVTIGMHLYSICNRRTTNVRYDMIYVVYLLNLSDEQKRDRFVWSGVATAHIVVKNSPQI